MLSVAMLAGLVLLFAAWRAWRRGDRRTAWLMAGAGAVILLNIGMWTLPTANGDSLAGVAARRDAR